MSSFMRMFVLMCTVGMLIGCSGNSKDPATFTVYGKVTVDGKPLTEGNITFRDSEGRARSYAGKIENGEYSLESSAGLKQVTITATREVPGKKAVGGAPDEIATAAIEQYLPKKYNEKTTLEANVKDSGTNEFSYDLESK